MDKRERIHYEYLKSKTGGSGKYPPLFATEEEVRNMILIELLRYVAELRDIQLDLIKVMNKTMETLNERESK